MKANLGAVVALLEFIEVTRPISLDDLVEILGTRRPISFWRIQNKYVYHESVFEMIGPAYTNRNSSNRDWLRYVGSINQVDKKIRKKIQTQRKPGALMELCGFSLRALDP